MIEPGVPAFKLFSVLFPFRPDEADRKRYPELRNRYKAFSVLEVIPFFVFVGLASYLWYEVLRALDAWTGPGRSHDAVFFVGPTVYYWVLLSFFLGMISSALPLHFFYKIILRERYHDYVLYNNMRAGFDTWKLVRYLAVLIAIPALLFAFLGMDTYMKVTDRGITLNRFWTLTEHHYAFSTIKAVKSASRFRAPNGKEVERPHFVIDFNDGTKWTTRDWLREPDPEQDGKLASYVAAKCGKTVQPVELDE